MYVCPRCGRRYSDDDLTADLQHYEDTDMLCDDCLADVLGIQIEESGEP